MVNEMNDFMQVRRPTSDRPLLGQSVLVVEDSRHSGEALRLMCMKGGARIRRADCLKAADRHLISWRPSIVVIDLGLPDGSGLDLIARLDVAVPRVTMILAVSGDPELQQSALTAGADGFLAKPFGSVANFHEMILAKLPTCARPLGPRAICAETVEPDVSALLDDFALIAELVDGTSDRATVAYALNFARGIGRSTGDTDLLTAVSCLDEAIDKGRPLLPAIGTFAGLIQARIGGHRMAV